MRGPPARLAPSLLIVLAGACNGDPSGPDTKQTPFNASQISVVELSGASTVLVHESTLLTVIARDGRGRVISNPPHPVFSTSNGTVLEVDSYGTVRGLRRGSATISVRIADASAAMPIRVRARLRIRVDFAPEWYQPWRIGIGDTLGLSAGYVDVDGVPIGDLPVVTWRSGNLAVAEVDTSGRVIASAVGGADIDARAQDDTTSALVLVEDVDTGEPATIRLAHTMKGMGPLTFVPNSGDSVTLSYGESLERPITPGLFMLHVRGLPAGDPTYEVHKQYYGLIHGGDRVTIYAVGGPSQGFITAAWSSAQNLPADSVRVRLVQGWNSFGVVYLRATGAPVTGLPELCYFDPMDVSAYYSLAPGGFDVILQQKYGGTAVVRLAADVAAGRAVTLVLAGSTTGDMEILTFIDQ